MLGGIMGKELGNHSCSHDQKGVVVVDATGLSFKPGFCFVFLKVVILHPIHTRKAIQGTFLYGFAETFVIMRYFGNPVYTGVRPYCVTAQNCICKGSAAVPCWPPLTKGKVVSVLKMLCSLLE